MEWFRYDPLTGKLYWKKNRRRAKAGDEVGTDNHGYRVVRLNGEAHPVHRIIWTMYRGRPGDKEILHDDQDKLNNRLSNLSLDTQAENMKNKKIAKNNSSGVVGVHWDKQRKKWRALIRIDGELKHLGYYIEKQAAIAARKAAEKKYGFHKLHGS